LGTGFYKEFMGLAGMTISYHMGRLFLAISSAEEAMPILDA
jgi:hypothetical protein